MKLVLIGVLAGALGLVGCGDDATSGGGTGGTGGAGGTGGTGGSVLPVCGAGESIGEGFITSTSGSVSCEGLEVITVPIEVVLAAKADAVDGETDVELQVQFILSEETVAELGAYVQTADIGAASAAVGEINEGPPGVDVPATVPCTADFNADPDDNGTAGPIVVTTPVKAGTFTAVDGTLVLEAFEMTFDIIAPLPLMLSTGGVNPACTWVVSPTVTLPAP